MNFMICERKEPDLLIITVVWKREWSRLKAFEPSEQKIKTLDEVLDLRRERNKILDLHDLKQEWIKPDVSGLRKERIELRDQLSQKSKECAEVKSELNDLKLLQLELKEKLVNAHCENAKMNAIPLQLNMARAETKVLRRNLESLSRKNEQLQSENQNWKAVLSALADAARFKTEKYVMQACSPLKIATAQTPAQNDAKSVHVTWGVSVCALHASCLVHYRVRILDGSMFDFSSSETAHDEVFFVEGQPFYVHSQNVFVHSSVLERIVNEKKNEMKEDKIKKEIEEEQISGIELNDVTADEFRHFLNAIYPVRNGICAESVGAVLKLAVMYKATVLFPKCERFLRSEEGKKICVVQRWDWAARYRMNDLQEDLYKSMNSLHELARLSEIPEWINMCEAAKNQIGKEEVETLGEERIVILRNHPQREREIKIPLHDPKEEPYEPADTKEQPKNLLAQLKKKSEECDRVKLELLTLKHRFETLVENSDVLHFEKARLQASVEELTQANTEMGNLRKNLITLHNENTKLKASVETLNQTKLEPEYLREELKVSHCENMKVSNIELKETLHELDLARERVRTQQKNINFLSLQNENLRFEIQDLRSVLSVFIGSERNESPLTVTTNEAQADAQLVNFKWRERTFFNEFSRCVVEITCRPKNRRVSTFLNAIHPFRDGICAKNVGAVLRLAEMYEAASLFAKCERFLRSEEGKKICVVQRLDWAARYRMNDLENDLYQSMNGLHMLAELGENPEWINLLEVDDTLDAKEQRYELTIRNLKEQQLNQLEKLEKKSEECDRVKLELSTLKYRFETFIGNSDVLHYENARLQASIEELTLNNSEIGALRENLISLHNENAKLKASVEKLTLKNLELEYLREKQKDSQYGNSEAKQGDAKLRELLHELSLTKTKVKVQRKNLNYLSFHNDNLESEFTAADAPAQTDAKLVDIEWQERTFFDGNSRCVVEIGCCPKNFSTCWDIKTKMLITYLYNKQEFSETKTCCFSSQDPLVLFVLNKTSMSLKKHKFSAMEFGVNERQISGIELSDVTAEEFRHFLNAIYASRDGICAESVRAVLKLADMYEATVLFPKCEHFLRSEEGKKIGTGSCSEKEKRLQEDLYKSMNSLHKLAKIGDDL
ncbi:unnamed protein product [Caenorhabditis auriculariae]|uniref:BTB domain-containing protein n=1 Tax=Caenorhabditis auriculariae TaxID=2777116 RepID=A0A8S1HSN7_9PELO|nr:unnamed protein product [Caenorhabditis auriculariae]